MILFSENFVLKKHQVLLLVIGGSAVRLIYGLISQVWNMAHDQNAWSLSIDDMVSKGVYIHKQLMHYPFEGGTFIISLLTLAIMPAVKTMSALSVAIFLLDGAGRYFQILLSRNIFGSRTAVWFGLWSIMAVPEVLPHGVTYFGLHAVSAALPFIFLYYAATPHSKLSRPAIAAVVTALSLMFSYNNIIFVPAFLVWIFVAEGSAAGKFKEAAKFILLLALCLVPHLIIRLTVDHGFNLDGFTLVINRKNWSDMTFWKGLDNWLLVWMNTLPASFFLSTLDSLSANAHRLIALLFIVPGLLVLLFFRHRYKKTALLGLLIVFWFTAFYAFSIFFAPDFSHKSFHYYRHFSYIIPLIVLLMIHGFTLFGKVRHILPGLWIIGCAVFSVAYMLNTTPVPEPGYRPAGWILAKKYGEDAGMIMSLYGIAPEKHKDELMFGFGWGLSATVLRNKHIEDTLQVLKLRKLYDQIPQNQKKLFAEGIYFAFQPGITPVLDPALVPVIEKHIPK